MVNKVESHSLFTDLDLYLFRSGKHHQLYKKFGCHRIEKDGRLGLYFAVYAPGAKGVQVIGDFNLWGGEHHNLYVRWDSSGIWEGFIPDLDYGMLYKYKIYSHHDEVIREKSDPFSFCAEIPPRTSSISWSQEYEWSDSDWMKDRKEYNPLQSPCSIYEMHVGSWKKNENGDSYSYAELAESLPAYLKDMGFTHVEFLPVMEHPYYPSWGYQITGYYEPTRRYGDPEDFKTLVDALHHEGIGVIIDWVPSHFAVDEHGLGYFDGSKVYEHPDPRKGFHPDWKSSIFNYERPEVVSFLLSSAHFWMDKYHVDGIRVDAVASMIYLDYSREEGQWEPNEFGGNENLAAIDFLRELNSSIFSKYPGALMIAEESTAFPGVTKPVHMGGLGFNLKWMMGWMNDTLHYMERDPFYRGYHHGEISFSMMYAYSENYVLPLSHDEVVHGKASLVAKMPGDEWQKFANLRLLLSFMYTHPGHKLLFMGSEFGQMSEWKVNDQLEWWVLKFHNHNGVQAMMKDLNLLYKEEKALHASDFLRDGFKWISHNDTMNCVLAYVRKHEEDRLIVLLNFTPQRLEQYLIGVPEEGEYEEIFNSDNPIYGGSGAMNKKTKTEPEKVHGYNQSLSLILPPLAGVVLRKV